MPHYFTLLLNYVFVDGLLGSETAFLLGDWVTFLN